MRPIKLSWIIHIFAILHALVALGCRLSGVDDQLLLTVLTMALSLIICMRMGLKIEFTAAIIITVNILGFLLGTLGANLLQSFIHSEYTVHCISTAITTEILGWSIVSITRVFGRKEVDAEELKSSPYIKWLLLIASCIFILRLIIVIFASRFTIEQDAVFEMIRRVMTNLFSLIILICINILFVRSIATREKPSSRASTIALYASFMILATLLEAFLVGSEGESFALLFIIALFVQITVYCIIYMINYAITARNEMQEEREKANMAQYRYVKLKHQVNPHFLFNSLNILDCLICEESPERASAYTHKLAGIYRYMLKSEDEMVVSLRDELVFVGLYVDLLKERFPAGFEVKTDVPEEQMSRMILPCAIQLLIENATKHNAVNEDNPLIIRIESIDDCIRVSNNKIPKMTKSSSTGLGQKYIRQMYLDLTGKQIEIIETEQTYSVTLPLI
jgi:hypothetical protein